MNTTIIILILSFGLIIWAFIKRKNTEEIEQPVPQKVIKPKNVTGTLEIKSVISPDSLKNITSVTPINIIQGEANQFQVIEPNYYELEFKVSKPVSEIFKPTQKYFNDINWENKDKEIKEQKVIIQQDITVNSLFFRSSDYFNKFNWDGKEIAAFLPENTISAKNNINNLENSKAIFYNTKDYFNKINWENEQTIVEEVTVTAKLSKNNTKSLIGQFNWD